MSECINLSFNELPCWVLNILNWDVHLLFPTPQSGGMCHCTLTHNPLVNRDNFFVGQIFNVDIWKHSIIDFKQMLNLWPRIHVRPLTLSTAATLEWRRRSHGKGVRRP